MQGTNDYVKACYGLDSSLLSGLNPVLLGGRNLGTNTTEALHTQFTSHTCQYSHVFHNYSLLYGRNAGNFTDQGKVNDMRECLRLCCKELSCKIALMLGRDCYSVACFGKFCRTVPVKPLQFNPKIAHVIRQKGKHERLRGLCTIKDNATQTILQITIEFKLQCNSFYSAGTRKAIFIGDPCDDRIVTKLTFFLRAGFLMFLLILNVFSFLSTCSCFG